MYVCEALPCCCYLTIVESHWREYVVAAKKLRKRERQFEDDVFIKNTRLGSGSKRRTKFTRGRSFKHITWFFWPIFPEIFVVGTSGIPPKLNYRSVTSYIGENWNHLTACKRMSSNNLKIIWLTKDLIKNRNLPEIIVPFTPLDRPQSYLKYQ